LRRKEKKKKEEKRLAEGNLPSLQQPAQGRREGGACAESSSKVNSGHMPCKRGATQLFTNLYASREKKKGKSEL